jgi:hypothetical protein
MKVKNIVEKSREFERLQDMVANIAEVLVGLKPKEEDDSSDITISFSSLFISYGKKVELDSDVVEYIVDDLKKLLAETALDLTRKQESLEV